MSETHIIHRQLSPSQRERRQRILDAATRLAEEGGYEAVGMKEVAADAGVSLGTVYRYFSSKDHLLAEALRDWGSVLGQRLKAHPPRARTAAGRVASVFRRMARGVEERPELGAALTRAMLSTDPSAFANREGLTAMMREWIDIALGDEPIPNRADVSAVLAHVCFGCMVGLANGQRTPRQIGDELERTVHMLVR